MDLFFQIFSKIASAPPEKPPLEELEPELFLEELKPNQTYPLYLQPHVHWWKVVLHDKEEEPNLSLTPEDVDQ